MTNRRIVLHYVCNAHLVEQLCNFAPDNTPQTLISSSMTREKKRELVEVKREKFLEKPFCVLCVLYHSTKAGRQVRCGKLVGIEDDASKETADAKYGVHVGKHTFL